MNGRDGDVAVRGANKKDLRGIPVGAQDKGGFMQDRRKHARFKSATIVQYKNSVFAAHTDSVTQDVSLGGVCFFSEKKLQPGQVIKLKLFYDPKAPARVLKGKIAWSQECKDKLGQNYLNGVAFLR